MSEILAILCTNGATLTYLTVGLTFRKMIFRVWKMGVRLLCSALYTAASVFFIVCGSLLTVLYAAGVAGGALLGEIAVDYVHPTVFFLLVSFATTLLCLLHYYMIGISSDRSGRFLFRLSRVVEREREGIDAYDRPRFFLLQ